MKPGETYQFLKDEENPLASPNTHVVASLLTAGGELCQPGGYQHTLSKDDQGKSRRTVTWLLKEKPIDIGGETISTKEFLRRWRDRPWCLANPDHPISWMKAYQENLGELRNQIASQSPQVRITRGGRIFTLTTRRAEDGTLVPDENAEKLLRQFS